MASIRVAGLGIRRGRTWILRDFEWSHRAGAIAWLVGENGAGKSSLLRILAGRERASRGEVTRRGSGRILYYHPGMRLPPEVRLKDWDRLVDELTAGATPIDALRPDHAQPGTSVGRLSTGEAKRVQLEAILRRPAGFVFLDEPFSHLSADGQSALTDVLVERARTRVVVVATNQAIPARADGPRVAVERPEGTGE